MMENLIKNGGKTLNKLFDYLISKEQSISKNISEIIMKKRKSNSTLIIFENKIIMIIQFPCIFNYFAYLINYLFSQLSIYYQLLKKTQTIIGSFCPLSLFSLSSSDSFQLRIIPD
jgi:hypothetical protein